MRFLAPLGIFGLVVAVLWIGIQRAPEKSIISSPLIGKPAPAFTLPNLTDSNATVSSESLKGRWYLLNVWGTWCVECRAEHQVLLDLQKSGAIPIIGLNWKDDDAAALEWLARLGNPYEVIATDRDGRAAINWGVYGAPESFLVSPAGVVVHKRVGVMTHEIWDKEFAPLMSATAPDKT